MIFKIAQIVTIVSRPQSTLQQCTKNKIQNSTEEATINSSNNLPKKEFAKIVSRPQINSPNNVPKIKFKISSIRKI